MTSVQVAVWDPEVRDRVQKVLNPGTRMELAAENFETPEEFVTVAHAARNTSVPFVRPQASRPERGADAG